MKKLMENKLNMVTGGDVYDTAVDSQALYFKGYMNEQFDFTDLLFRWIDNSKKVDEGWARAGITSVTCFNDYNRYYKDGKRISRKTAMKLIGVI